LTRQAYHATEPPALNWEHQPEADSRVGQPAAAPSRQQPFPGASLDLNQSSISPIPRSSPSFAFGTTRVSLDNASQLSPVFTLSLDGETIQLLPFRNWGQLDVYKWQARGKIPGTPPGLEVTLDHVKLGNETVRPSDLDACTRLEAALNSWVLVEQKNSEAARKIGHHNLVQPASFEPSAVTAPMRYRVEVDKRAQVHVSCLRGPELVASIGLTVAGFNGLVGQGLMRRPHQLDVGALHDWIELDRESFSFEHGRNDSLKLEQTLNQHYLPPASEGQGTDIIILSNAASPTGFDIQFPAKIGGVLERRRRSLDDSALDLLQEPTRCGLLQPGLIVKISPPTFIFKRKTHDGGEAYLESSLENRVVIRSDDGSERVIDLSQPVNYSRLTVVEMTSVFNHPAVNRHSCAVNVSVRSKPAVLSSAPESNAPGSPKLNPAPTPHWDRGAFDSSPAPAMTPAPANPGPPCKGAIPLPGMPGAITSEPPPLPPNDWLRSILARTSIRFDWFACLVYSSMAAQFGNSREGMLGPKRCWSIALGNTTEIATPDFKGLFLTEKGGLGFIGQGRLVRFHRGVVFLGSTEAVLEGIGVSLTAVGLDYADRIIFVVTEEYRSRFGVSAQQVSTEEALLTDAGAKLLTIAELLASPDPVKILWTVPAEQTNPNDPQPLVGSAIARG
jgi:hypothetical protein